MEERVEHGRERIAGRLDAFSSCVCKRRADLDRRFTLLAGQWRGEPHGSGVLLPRNRYTAHSEEGSVHRVAASGDRETLDFHGIRRRLERSNENCGARDGRFSCGAEDGADVPRGGLRAHIHGGGLPRLGGCGHPQRRALYGAEVHLCQKIAGGVAHTSVLRVGLFSPAALLFFITRLNQSRPSRLLPSRKTTNCSTANPLGDAPAFWSPGSHAYTRASRELSLCSRR